MIAETLIRSTVTAAVAEIKHEVVELWVDTSRIARLTTRDEWGVWNWTLYPSDRFGHLRWDIECEVCSGSITTQLGHPLSWSDLGTAMREAVSIITKRRPVDIQAWDPARCCKSCRCGMRRA